MSYNILTGSSFFSAMYPPGAIMAYVNATSSSDPSGWVICDGVARSINDTRYINVVSLGIGSSAGGNYTPPNLRGTFLRGATVATSPYVGPNVNAFQDQQIINHGHTVADHTHATISNASNYFAMRMTASNTIGGVDTTGAGEINAVNNLIKLNNNGNTANTSTVAITSSSSVSGVSGGVETRPYNYGVYWILKL